MIFTNLHYARSLLNPFFINIIEIQNNCNTKPTLNKVMQKLNVLLGADFNKVINEVT
jgi:hypothetical protein